MKEIAVIETDKGIIKFEFYEKDAPNTVNNFKKLADKKFYNGLKFHRVVPDFVIQGGCPNGNGTGNPGYKIKAEFNKRQHLDGTVAMARSQEPDSAGCQFYICMGPQPFLDGKYTVFGQVIEGLDVVYQIEIGDVMKKVYIEKQKEVNKTKSETK
ncbi:MAG: peptidylprolyl isomerase [Elusimicrobia bacterium RIFOXYC2_FULL_34_12]|nr:MAG: peptidylprolyl isomerase [Elusimicrobia bacterium RIFOXYC2_FULL_34_12]OGS38820.1 MAG: peptidylprolyl isomerase [Elusimicrobia bacterium RIFOXYD2_FULL_34_30]HAM37937.1 peptidylprolyl isomerase [Elusimicrobiota bacterium]